MFGRSIAGLAVLLVTLGMVSHACAPGPAASVGPEPTAQASVGSYTLTFELTKGAWAASETIEGTASLSYSGVGSHNLSGSGSGLLGFGFSEVGGSRNMGPAFTLDCRPYEIGPDEPISSPIRMNGAWSLDDPNGPLYMSVIREPKLPAGDWDLYAVASFIEGQGCVGEEQELTATIRIHVTG
jgi:hypothetical protein